MVGLCGIYALVNTVKHLAGKNFTKTDASDLFKELIRSLYKRNNRRRKNKPKSPIEFIWEGTSVRDISLMLRTTKEFLKNNNNLDLVWKKPLQGRRRPKKIDQYWRQLQASFESYGGQGKCVAIVDYNWQCDSNEKDGHWTCVTKVTKDTLILYDSYLKGGRTFSKLLKSRCTLGFPNVRKPNQLLAHNVSILRVIPFASL